MTKRNREGRMTRRELGRAGLGLALVVAIWLSTFFAQVSRHAVLARGFDARAHAALVTSNGIRMVGWTARGALGLWWLARMAA